MPRRTPEDHLRTLNQAVTDSDLLKPEDGLVLGGTHRRNKAKGGRNVLDSLAEGGIDADKLLEDVPADILSDAIRCLLRLDVAILFAASRDDGSLLVTLYQNGKKRFVTPRSANDFTSRLEALLLENE